MSNRVSIEQQIAMGIRQEPKYVHAVVPSQQPPVKVEVLPPAHERVDLVVTPTATAHIDMRTSAKDRAIGFLIASMPRTFAFSLAVTLAAITLAGVTLGAAFVILFSVFSVVEIVSYVFTLAISAEGTAYMEAKQKWQVIKREQQERWKHYNRMTGGE